ncbi:MAG TPA: head GIN domain-containing protein [Protaetiibacter sp.]|nr:head GIN domain-containing protein [Protaetiibacter sp.]
MNTTTQNETPAPTPDQDPRSAHPASGRRRRALVGIAAVAVAGLALAGCVRLPGVASGPRVETEHEVSDAVHALRLETAGDVTVELGDEPGLTVRAPKSVSDRLTVDEEDGTLVLGIRGPGWTSGKVSYTLTVRSFDELDLQGAGDVTADFSDADEVEITVSGAGDVRATGVDAARVEVEISGAGDVRIEGTADEGELKVDGAGTIRASKLVLTRAEAEVSGAGDIHVHATATLDAEVSGLGDIHVSGDPRITREVSGLGDIVEG